MIKTINDVLTDLGYREEKKVEINTKTIYKTKQMK